MRIPLKLPGALLAVLAAAVSLLLALDVPSLRAQEPVADTVVLPAATPALVPISGIKQVGLGTFHTCAVTSTGGVKCWGRDNFGQLGDGPDNTDKNLPVDVVGLGSGVKAVEAGFHHTCALMNSGAVKCWGADDVGQLGDGDGDSTSSVPVDVANLTSGVQAMTAGGSHSCALTTAGALFCWGKNDFGQVGDGGATNRFKPVPVVGMASGVKAVAAGGFTTCAAMTAVGARCWGYDSSGQVGDGPGSNTGTPVSVLNLNVPVQSVAVGAVHSCALTNSGAVKCWGANVSGQLGAGLSIAFSDVPVNVEGLQAGARTLALGSGHSCASTDGGGAFCWGSAASGALGDGQGITDRNTPIRVEGLASGVQAVAAGDSSHTCALMTSGGLKCWGFDGFGAVGDGANSLVKFSPVDVLVPQTCFQLTMAGSGGPAPLASPAFSPGCPAQHFLAGTTLTLVVAAPAGSRVQEWSAPASGLSGATVASLTMPAADRTVTVTYQACRALKLTKSGTAGLAPLAAPDRSLGCPANQYGAGERITLTTLPAANQRVQAWTGATTAPAAGSQVNALTMPDGAHVIDVAYESCFALNLARTGEGAAPVAGPAATDGCLSGGYAAGQSVLLTANPAPGWRVAGWQGTANDASRATTNTLLMPASSTNMRVLYEAAQFLPLVQR